VRHNEDIISVWNKNAENTEAKNKIRSASYLLLPDSDLSLNLQRPNEKDFEVASVYCHRI
jgi:hypothetical protein